MMHLNAMTQEEWGKINAQAAWIVCAGVYVKNGRGREDWQRQIYPKDALSVYTSFCANLFTISSTTH